MKIGRDAVAVILAVGIATALNLLMVAILWDALRSDSPGISENATQIIIAALGGIVGILGGYIGGRATERAQQLARQAHDRDAFDIEPSRDDAP